MKLTTWICNKVIVSKYLYTWLLYIFLLTYSVFFLPPLDQFEFCPFHFSFLHNAFFLFFWINSFFIIYYSIHQLLIAYLSYDCPDFLVLNVMYVRTQDFPGSSVIKNLSANAGDTGSISDPGRSPGEGNDNSLSILIWKTLGQRSLAGYSP